MLPPLNRIGQITQGDLTGYYVIIKKDNVKTGGYYIFTSKNEDLKESYDNWAADESDLNAFLKNSKWIINWNYR